MKKRSAVDDFERYKLIAAACRMFFLMKPVALAEDGSEIKVTPKKYWNFLNNFSHAMCTEAFGEFDHMNVQKEFEKYCMEVNAFIQTFSTKDPVQRRLDKQIGKIFANANKSIKAKK